MSQGFFEDTLPKATRALLTTLQGKSLDWMRGFYLSGGTALSLQLGHRESEDLDFFCEQRFDPLLLQQKIGQYGRLEELEVEKDTLNTWMSGVKLQFLGYHYPLLEPLRRFEQIQLSSVLDIACTKLQTVGMRGSKKDFVDLYVLLEQYSLDELLVACKKKYAGIDLSVTHILKSMVYFDDAREQAMPRMHREIEWGVVVARMEEVVKEYMAKNSG